jgi:eukaryotic-like serine/threonine-protein kinase
VDAVQPAPRLADDHDDEDDPDVPRHRQAGEPLPENERPFGRYTLLRRLAYGGMGEVFLARQGGQGSLSEIAKLVVIKRILAHVKRDEKHRRMFLDEARLQAVLNSPHIVHVHDMGEEAGHVYLAMEHVHGPSWRAIVDRCKQLREPIPLAYVCEMVAQCARGMSYAHNLVDVTGQALRIVHRDINPHNVLVSYDGEVKIIDFGIAKSELGSGHTETGTIKGKFQYMSPEQSAAEKLDKRSDIFTLGICLYELLALENPFHRTNVVLSLEAIQKFEPPPVHRKRPDAAMFEPIVRKCLMKHRADRYPDCADLANALDDLLTSGMVPPPPAPLSVWLRERFSTEIAEHLQILEATGSVNAMVARGRSDPSSLPRPRTKVEKRAVSVEDPTNPNHDNGPFHRGEKRDKSLEVEVDPSDFVDELDPTGPVGLEQPELDISAQPTQLHDLSAGPLPHDLTAATPAPARLPSAPMPAAPGPTRGAGAWLAALAVMLLFGGTTVFLLVDPLNVTKELGPLSPVLESVRGFISIAPSGPVADPTDPADPTPVEVKPVDPTPTDPTPADPTLSDPGAVDPIAAADAGPIAAADAGVSKQPEPKKRPTPRPKEPQKELVEAAPKEVAGTLLVTTEGYLVKGNKKLPKAGSTTLRIDGAPFALTLKATDGDTVTVQLQSEPWAIVTVDNVGKGRTPQTFTLTKGKRTAIALKNPAQPTMTISVQLAAP